LFERSFEWSRDHHGPPYRDLTFLKKTPAFNSKTPWVPFLRRPVRTEGIPGTAQTLYVLKVNGPDRFQHLSISMGGSTTDDQGNFFSQRSPQLPQFPYQPGTVFRMDNAETHEACLQPGRGCRDLLRRQVRTHVHRSPLPGGGCDRRDKCPEFVKLSKRSCENPGRCILTDVGEAEHISQGRPQDRGSQMLVGDPERSLVPQVAHGLHERHHDGVDEDRPAECRRRPGEHSE